MFTLFAPSLALGQGVSLAGACPAACGIKVHITNAVIGEATDGILVRVDWTIDPPRPEIKLDGFKLFVEVDLGLDKVRNSINVSANNRSATIKLSRNLEFDFKDVKTLHTDVRATAVALPPIPVTSILSRKVTGEGRDAAVEVEWGNPSGLPCSADSFDVKVSAQNGDGDKLSGQRGVPLSQHAARIELSGERPGKRDNLRNPDATIQVLNKFIECVDLKNFPPVLVTQAGSGAGSNGPETAKVTITSFNLKADSGRVFAEVTWDPFVPTNFKTTQFDLKFDVELTNGKTLTSSQFAFGTQRSFNGGEGLGIDGEVRRVTVTVKATFRDNANTTVLTREDKQSRQIGGRQLSQPKP